MTDRGIGADDAAFQDFGRVVNGGIVTNDACPQLRLIADVAVRPDHGPLHGNLFLYDDVVTDNGIITDKNVRVYTNIAADDRTFGNKGAF